MAEVTAALDYLAKHAGIREGMTRAFRQALDTPDPMARATCARATYDLMCRHLGRPDPAMAEAQRRHRQQRRRAND